MQAPSTVHWVLGPTPDVTADLAGSAQRAAIRYERSPARELVRVDVKEFGRQTAVASAFPGRDSLARRCARNAGRVSYDYVHCGIDGHTRLVYAEIHPDSRLTPAPRRRLHGRPRHHRQRAADD